MRRAARGKWRISTRTSSLLQSQKLASSSRSSSGVSRSEEKVVIEGSSSTAVGAATLSPGRLHGDSQRQWMVRSVVSECDAGLYISFGRELCAARRAWAWVWPEKSTDLMFHRGFLAFQHTGEVGRAVSATAVNATIVKPWRNPSSSPLIVDGAKNHIKRRFEGMSDFLKLWRGHKEHSHGRRNHSCIGRNVANRETNQAILIDFCPRFYQCSRTSGIVPVYRSGKDTRSTEVQR